MNKLFLLQQAVQYINKKEFIPAKNICGEILQQIPNSSEALFLLGIIELEQKNLKQSIFLFEKALVANSNNLDVLYWLGIAYDRANEKNNAISYLQKLVRLFPQTSQAKQANQYLRSILFQGIWNYNYFTDKDEERTFEKQLFVLQEDVNNAKNINIVYFHVENQRHWIRNHFKITDYYWLLSRSIESARRIYPRCKIIVLTDQHTNFDNIGIDEILRSDISNDRTSIARIQSRLQYLVSESFDADTVFVDTDVLFNKNLSNFFELEFDIGLTFRTVQQPYEYSMLYNGGVLMAKKDHSKACVKYHELLLDCFAQLESLNEIKMMYPQGINRWYGGQLATATLVGRYNISQQEYGYVTFKGIRVVLLPGDLFNSTFDIHHNYKKEHLSSKYILHFKGKTKENRQFVENILSLISN